MLFFCLDIPCSRHCWCCPSFSTAYSPFVCNLQASIDRAAELAFSYGSIFSCRNSARCNGGSRRLWPEPIPPSPNSCRSKHATSHCLDSHGYLLDNTTTCRTIANGSHGQGSPQKHRIAVRANSCITVGPKSTQSRPRNLHPTV